MELFIKRFIDLLDEKVPVKMVHTVIEQPLGAIINNSYVRVHASTILNDEKSPYIEIELYPQNHNNIKLLYALSFPKDGIFITENDFINSISKFSGIKIRKVSPVENINEYLFEVFYEEDVLIPKNNTDIDSSISEIVSKIIDMLSTSEYNTLLI